MELTRADLQEALSNATRGQEIRFRDMLDERLKPVNEHIARVDRGELTDAQKFVILSIVREDRDEGVVRRNLKMPVIAVLLSFASLVAVVVLTLTTAGSVGG